MGDVLKGDTFVPIEKWQYGGYQPLRQHLELFLILPRFFTLDLGKVKLKSVERSPNGTPVRPPPNPATPVDAASLIAAALKKRFNANYRYEVIFSFVISLVH